MENAEREDVAVKNIEMYIVELKKQIKGKSRKENIEIRKRNYCNNINQEFFLFRSSEKNDTRESEIYKF